MRQPDPMHPDPMHLVVAAAEPIHLVAPEGAERRAEGGAEGAERRWAEGAWAEAELWAEGGAEGRRLTRWGRGHREPRWGSRYGHGGPLRSRARGGPLRSPLGALRLLRPPLSCPGKLGVTILLRSWTLSPGTALLLLDAAPPSMNLATC